MPRRTIKRRPRSKVDILNRETSDVTVCVWPGCDSQSMRPQLNRRTGTVVLMRVGALCWEHADAVADAVLEERVIIADFMHHEVAHHHFDALRREDDQARRQEQRSAEIAKVRGEHPGFVYYLRVGDRIKVGYSVDVKRRMRAYPPGSELLAVEPGTTRLENERHRQFAGLLLDGREWFASGETLLEHIEQLAEKHGIPAEFKHSYRSSRGQMRPLRR